MRIWSVAAAVCVCSQPFTPLLQLNPAACSVFIYGSEFKLIRLHYIVITKKLSCYLRPGFWLKNKYAVFDCEIDAALSPFVCLPSKNCLSCVMLRAFTEWSKMSWMLNITGWHATKSYKFFFSLYLLYVRLSSICFFGGFEVLQVAATHCTQKSVNAMCVNNIFYMHIEFTLFTKEQQYCILSEVHTYL